MVVIRKSVWLSNSFKIGGLVSVGTFECWHTNTGLYNIDYFLNRIIILENISLYEKLASLAFWWPFLNTICEQRSKKLSSFWTESAVIPQGSKKETIKRNYAVGK